MSSKYRPLAPLAGYLCFFLKAFLAVQVLAVADQIWTHYFLTVAVRSIEKTPDTTAEQPILASPDEGGPRVQELDSDEATSEATDGILSGDAKDFEQELERLKKEADALTAKSEKSMEQLEHLVGKMNTALLTIYASLALYAAYFLLYVITSILFLKWVYRTYRNLRAFSGVEMRRTPAWTVWSYFVPVASLFVPPAVIEEMWVVSHRSPSGGLVGLWWLLAIISVFANQAITKSYVGDLAANSSIEAMPSHKLFLLMLGSDLVDLAVTALTLVLVTRITAAYKQHIVESLTEVSSEVATSS